MKNPSLTFQSKHPYLLAMAGMAFLAFVALRVTAPVGAASHSRSSAANRTVPTVSALAKDPATQARLVKAYGDLPLSFEANQGQADPDVKFLSRGVGYTLLLTGNEAVLALSGRSRKLKVESQASKEGEGLLSLFTGQILPALPDAPEATAGPALLRLKLAGANPNAAAAGLEELPGKSHYFLGDDPEKWQKNVPNYAKVKYAGVYPGVDLVYYGNHRQLEYDFVVAPGADPRTIALAIETGEPKLENRNSKIAENGDLVIAMEGGEVRFHKPVMYQERSAASGNPKSEIQNRKSVEGRYVLLAENRVGFEVGAYDKTRPLVIDPQLSYSTYLGGTDVEVALRIAVDASGSAYITGAAGPNFPTTLGSFMTVGANSTCYSHINYRSLTCPHAFVTKLSADGSAKVYSTYLGGSRADGGLGIGVDGAGSAYVTGSTSSSDFPTTSGALVTGSRSRGKIFVSKLSGDGSALTFSAILGGSSDDIATSSALDGSGNTYVTGLTFSSDFPATTGAYKTALTTGTCTFNSHTFPCPDAFVAKLNGTGTALTYATYLGGTTYDAGLGIAVDGSGNAYVTGATVSTDFPVLAAAQGTTSGGNCGPTRSLHPCADAFVTKLNAAGTGLGYSTYLGGTGDEIGTAITVDSAGNAYVAGITVSTDFPVTAGAAQSAFGGGACGSVGNSFNCPDAFAAKFNADGSSGYATYLGGGSYDGAFGIAVFAGNAYVVGATGSLDFPTASAIQATFGGGSCSTSSVIFSCPNAFLTRLNAAGSAPTFSTYLGGAGGDVAFGVAVDALGNAYLTGGTVSADFPTVTPLQANLGGKADVFIAKMSTSVVGPGAQLTPDSLAFGGQLKDSTSTAKTVTLTNNGDAVLTITGIAPGGTNADDFAQTNDCGGSLAPSADCAISVTFTPTATGDRTGTLIVTDNGPGGSQSIPLTGTGTEVSIAPASGSSTTATVSAGAAATYNLTFTPAGFVGTMTLVCTGAPTASTCTPNPASLPLDGTTVANVAVTVTTTSRTIAPPGSQFGPTPTERHPNSPIQVWWLALAVLAGLGAARRARSRPIPALRIALAATLLMIMVWAACGGSNNPPPNKGTPAGTYTLTLTGTAGSATRSTTLTLTVN